MEYSKKEKGKKRGQCEVKQIYVESIYTHTHTRYESCKGDCLMIGIDSQWEVGEPKRDKVKVEVLTEYMV